MRVAQLAPGCGLLSLIINGKTNNIHTAFSITWPTSMQIFYLNKLKGKPLHRRRDQLPQNRAGKSQRGIHMRNLERASNNGPRSFHFGHVRCHVIKFLKN